MTSPRRIVCIGDHVAAHGPALAVAPDAGAAAPPREPIALGATKVQRDEAARGLLPLLSDVRRRAEAPVKVGPGTVPDSPFAGTQTTLFAFTRLQALGAGGSARGPRPWSS